MLSEFTNVSTLLSFSNKKGCLFTLGLGTRFSLLLYNLLYLFIHPCEREPCDSPEAMHAESLLEWGDRKRRKWEAIL